MRIIGEIEHPVLKITVFKLNERLSVKFESGLYEQIYKFRSGQGADTLDEVRKIVDSDFIEDVALELQQMHRRKMTALARQLSAGKEEAFEEII